MTPAEETTPSRTPKRKQTFGIVSAHESYSVDEFRRRLNIGAKLWRELKARGLRVREAGSRRLFVLGSDWHEFLGRN